MVLFPKAPRFSEAKPNGCPGPGQYNVPLGEQSRYKKGAFLEKAERWKEGEQMSDNVDPCNPDNGSESHFVRPPSSTSNNAEKTVRRIRTTSGFGTGPAVAKERENFEKFKEKMEREREREKERHRKEMDDQRHRLGQVHAKELAFHRTQVSKLDSRLKEAAARSDRTEALKARESDLQQELATLGSQLKSISSAALLPSSALPSDITLTITASRTQASSNAVLLSSLISHLKRVLEMTGESAMETKRREERAKRRADEREFILTEMCRLVEDMEEEKELLAHNFDVLKSDFDTFSTLREPREDCARLTKERDEAKSRLADAQENLSWLEEDLNSTREGYEILRTLDSNEIQQLTDQIAWAERREVELEEQVYRLKEELESSREKRGERDKVVEQKRRLVAALGQSRSAECALRQDLTDANETITSLSHFKSSHSDLLEHFNTITNKNQMIERENTKLAQENGTLLSHNNNEQKIKAFDRMRGELTEARHRTAAANARLAATEAENTRLREEIDALQSTSSSKNFARVSRHDQTISSVLAERPTNQSHNRERLSDRNRGPLLRRPMETENHNPDDDVSEISDLDGLPTSLPLGAHPQSTPAHQRPCKHPATGLPLPSRFGIGGLSTVVEQTWISDEELAEMEQDLGMPSMSELRPEGTPIRMIGKMTLDELL